MTRSFSRWQIRATGPDSCVVSMDRDFADAIIHFALWRGPARVGAVLADVTCQLKAEGYSSGEIVAAIDELLDELEGSDQTRH